MRILVACEFSGVVRDAFRQRGHDAWSCDLLPCDGDEKWHLVGDALDCIINPPMGQPWDLMIAHPPCTYLCNSSVWALSKTPPNPSPGVLYGEARWDAMRKAAAFFRMLLDSPVPRIAIENPVMHGHARTIIGQRHAQIIQPYQFGDDASKATCLWLKNLPLLRPTRYVPPRIVNGRPRWSNQTDGGQNKLPPSVDRWSLRAETYPGIAAAMADQWADADEFSLTG